MKRKYWIFIAALAMVAVFVGLLSKRVYVEEARRKRNEAGYSAFALFPEPRRKAPDFTLKDLNGNQVSLKSMRGKVVMISFRTTW
jgi:cytochrome oxidase Cu insertion factor (SCO1/SenC/PrrC family)